MSGYNGTILRINLSKAEIKKEKLNQKLAQKFIGGRGLGTKIFYDEVDPKIDPLSEENKLIIAAGPLSGTFTPTGGRYMVITKSPLTHTIASSNSGGKWGAELKFAGYDVIIIEGKAENPVYITINDDTVEIKPAQEIWGKITSETTDYLVNKEGKNVKVLNIGPAGEKLSNIACIMNDYDRAAGRSGVGAVMGSKNLKAIVVKGSNKVGIAKPDELKDFVKILQQKIKDNGVTGAGLPAYGTAVLVNIINENGVFPTNNFQKSQFDKAEDISGELMAEKYLVKKKGCFACPIACGRQVKMDDKEVGGPEYETIWGFGGDCGISNMEAIIKANHLCNEYGLDTISASVTLATAMELFQNGKITKDMTENTPLVWGNDDAIIEWTKKMGLREGLGDDLAMGSYRLAEKYGMPELSMSVKKQELPAYDPRGIKGQGLAYATSNRGGCHVRAYLISPEILALPEKLDKFSLENKPVWVRIFQDLTAAIDSLGLCLFTSFAVNAEEYAKLYSLVTGIETSQEDILMAGDRIWNLERMFNYASGLTQADDILPKRLLNDPISEGPAKGHVHELNKLLPEYYKLRGWDENGYPTKETLQKLGL
ncbi:MAG: aldehyde ferredoxin oxidoreductase family protein [Candidatus Cloacimonetes bacterium]|nr:aldehyde ferredoxin oxidoreductase family protein [Candidatus Cloacimonadota bacterium]